MGTQQNKASRVDRQKLQTGIMEKKKKNVKKFKYNTKKVYGTK